MRDRWAVILAGGDGTRLQSMTRAISGDNRPKQFVPIIGGSTLLNQTRRRIALSIERDRTLIVVTQKHRQLFTPPPPHPRRTFFCEKTKEKKPPPPPFFFPPAGGGEKPPNGGGAPPPFR